jgi:class I fructose-bisphosphate aldolase
MTTKVKEILSWYESDNPGTKANLARLLMHGKLGGTGKFGAWNLHFGAEYQKLGDTTAFYNSDDDGDPQHNQFIGSVGFGFSY